MGGSWSGSQDDCWEYCFGKEQEVALRLAGIVEELNADGVDIDYEYFYEDNQNGSGFSRGEEAQTFLTEITRHLREALPANSLLTHTPMDADLLPGTAYFELLKGISNDLDFIMPQYYNGITRPITDGIGNAGPGRSSALVLYQIAVNDIFGGDPTRVVFGFCINACSSTSSNASGQEAATVLRDLSSTYPCHGGAFFWAADDDSSGSWSSVANQAISESCSSDTFCGHDWIHATTCVRPCPRGLDSECPGNLKCFSGIDC